MEEVWKDVKNYENEYQISSIGRCRSKERIVSIRWGNKRVSRSKILSPSKSKTGYLMVNLFKDNIGKSYTIHSLMANAFLNHVSDGFNFVVDHIDNDSTNNKLSNLQIISNRLNASKDRDKSKTTSKYIGVYFSKKRNKWVSHIRIGSTSINLGGFEVEKDASDFYQKAVEYSYLYKGNNKLFRTALNQTYSVTQNLPMPQ